MSKHSTQVSLNQIFDDVCLFVTNFVNASTTQIYGSSDTIGHYRYTPWKYNDWKAIYSTYTWKSDNSIPNYPVSNYKINEFGTSIIEIAVTGFDDDELSIQKHDLNIIVTGKKKEKQKDTCKYLYRNIGTRNFELTFSGSDQWNYEAIEADISKGILTIIIPVKEECKPTHISIKKK